MKNHLHFKWSFSFSFRLSNVKALFSIFICSVPICKLFPSIYNDLNLCVGLPKLYVAVLFGIILYDNISPSIVVFFVLLSIYKKDRIIFFI